MTDSVSTALQQLRIRHLRLLDVIHETGSLRRAAAEICLTQPAVTAMLKDLEHAFGTALVVRTSHGARLTEAGRSLRVRFGVILDGLRSAAAEGGLQRNAMRLRVGAMKAPMFDLIPSAVALLYRANRNTEVKLVDGSIERMVAALLDNDVDCLVGRLDGIELDADLRANLFEESLLPTPLGIACSRRHPLASRGHAPAAELVAHDWVLLPVTSQARIAFNFALRDHGFAPVRPAVESESLAANFHMVANSEMLTLAPRSAIAVYRELGVVEELRIDFPLAISPVSFICHRPKLSLPAIDAFREALRLAALRLRS